MNIIIFGASGRTGRRVVEAGLAEGHHVTAFVRSTPLSHSHPELTVVEGDVLDANRTAVAIAGQDVVISALKIRDTSNRIAAIESILEGMQRSGVRRILAIGGSGCLQVDDQHRYHETPEFPQRFLQTSLAHWEVFRRLDVSGLDFTFVCPPDIVEGDATGTYVTKVTFRPEGKRISTGDLATFMLKEVAQNAFLCQRVGICYPAT